MLMLDGRNIRRVHLNLSIQPSQAPISGATSTLDRNSQQAKIQGRTPGPSVDLGGHKAQSGEDKGEAEVDELEGVASRSSCCQYLPTRPKARSNV